MSKERLVIIGAVAAGTSAAAKARRTDPELEIILLERGADISYSACGLPHYIAGVVSSAEQLVARSVKEFRDSGVDVRIRHQVDEIDAANRQLSVSDLDSQTTYRLPYDRLVIATGATPIRPAIQGLDLDGVWDLRTLDDGRALEAALNRERPQRAVIIGAGSIGVEMAEAFRARGLEVTIVEMRPQVLPYLDEEMAALVHAELERQGVQLLLKNRVLRCEGSAAIERVITEQGPLPADLVLVAVGVCPNTSLAKQAGVALGAGGAIAVDEQMRTSMDRIWAAGDCAETLHQVTREKVYLPMGTTANKQGRTAGANAAGGQLTFQGVAGTALAKVFELQVARTGLNEREAKEKGLNVRSTSIVARDRASYYPGVAPLHVRLTVDASSGRLLGGQIVGMAGVAKRIDTLATAVYGGFTVEDLTRIDYGYAPPFASAWEAILIAADVATKS